MFSVHFLQLLLSVFVAFFYSSYTVVAYRSGL